MEASGDALYLVTRFEGCKLEAYPDGPNSWSIGYGHLINERTEQHLLADRISMREAIDLLRKDMRWAEQAVNDLVLVPLTQGQFDALVSLVYNIGASNFQQSTLLRLLNEGKYLDVPLEWVKWRKDEGKIQRGLLRRRLAEATLFVDSTP